MAQVNVEYLEATSLPELKALVVEALSVAMGSDAVSREVTGTASNSGTPDSVITVGGVSLIVGDDVVVGADAAAFVAAIVAALTAALETIPAESVTDNLDGTFTIVFIPGANALEVSSDDPNLDFAEDVAGADAVYTSQLAGPVTVYVTRDRTGANDAYEDTIHFVQTLNQST